METFEGLGLDDNLLKATDELGFVSPTEIQKKTIPHLLNTTTDLIALAQTGTGKTAAFGLPIIQLIDCKNTQVQAIILSPTRELCLQIASDFENYSKNIKDLNVVAVYGGSSIDIQARKLRTGCQVVVATPGRALDLIKRGILKISKIKWLVLDEADEMLNMGFKEDLDSILSNASEKRQTLLFSATMPNEIRQIARQYMNNPENIEIDKKEVGAKNIKHSYYTVLAKNKYAVLKRVIDINPNIYGIVFCRTRQDTKDVAELLIKDGYSADALHGDLSQSQRDHVMNRFRIKGIQLLIATDVAARGLDVNDLTHIINYSLPEDFDAYIHRSGRTGRAGKSGSSITILHSKEVGKIKQIEKKLNKQFEHCLVPTGIEVCEKQLFNLINKVENIEVDETQIERFLPVIYKKLSWLDRESLIKHFVSVEFNSFLNYYRDSEDLNIKDRSERGERRERGERNERGERSERGERRERGERGVKSFNQDSGNSNENVTRFFINVGSNNDVNKLKMIGIINDTLRPIVVQIGKIDILRNFSFFEIDKSYENDVLKAFKNASYKKQPISVEVSKEKPSEPKKFRKNKK